MDPMHSYPPVTSTPHPNVPPLPSSDSEVFLGPDIDLPLLEAAQVMVEIWQEAKELTAEPLRLVNPVRIALGEGEAVFTHHLGGTVFGDEHSLRRYQSIAKTIEEKWPALPKLIDAQLPNNRIAVFTTNNTEAIKQLNKGGHWGAFASKEALLKDFNAGIVVDVKSGQASLYHVTRDWWREIQLNAHLNKAEQWEVVTCWWKGYKEYQPFKMSLPQTDPRHLIYGKPARHLANIAEAVGGGQKAIVTQAWKDFALDIGSHMASARLEHGYEAIQTHAGELGQLIDQKLGIRAFAEPCSKKFNSQLLSLTKRHVGRALAIVGLGVDVYHAYTQLPNDKPNKKVHALINGSTSYLMGQIAFWAEGAGSSALSEALLYDTSHLGSSADAKRAIEKSVGQDQLRSILVKGERARFYESLYEAGRRLHLPRRRDLDLLGRTLQSLSSPQADPKLRTLRGLIPLSNLELDVLGKTLRVDSFFEGEEREIYFTYMNASLRQCQEFIQEPIGNAYDALQQKMSNFFLRLSPEPEDIQRAICALEAEIQCHLVKHNVRNAAQRDQVAEAVVARADEIFGNVPAREPALSPEQIARALPPANSASASESHFLYPIPASGEPAAEHPLLTDLKQIKKEADGLLADFNAGNQEGHPVDPAIFERIEQLTEKSEEKLRQLQAHWDRKDEYYLEAMRCVGIVTDWFYHDQLLSREQRAQDAALDAQQRAVDYRKSQLREAMLPRMAYVEIEHFVQDQFLPQGFQTHNLFELRRNAKSVLAQMNDLQERRNVRKEGLQSLDQLWGAVDRNDKALQRDFRKELKRKQKIAKGLRRLTNFLGSAAGIMATFACPAAYVGAASTAGAVSQLGQAIVGKRMDRTADRLRRAQEKSLQQYEKIAQAGQHLQYELSAIEGQLQQYQQLFLGKHLFDSQGTREGLNMVVTDQEHRLNSLKLTLQDYRKQIAELDRTIQIKEAEIREHESKYKATKHHKYKKRRDGAEQTRNERMVEKIRIQGLINSTKDRMKDLTEQNSDANKQLKEEEFLAPMKEQIESVILGEQRRLDFDRHSEGADAGDLTPWGQAQRQMRVSFEQYNQARMAERYAILGSTQAAKGLSQELCHLWGARNPTLAIDLGEQIYRIHDLQKHFTECAIPQFHKFFEVLQQNDAPFVDKMRQIHVVELVGGFVIPGAQLVTAYLAVLRLSQALRNTQRLTPEQEFIINIVEQAFHEQQKFLNERFDQLQNHLERHHAELTDELEWLRSDIACIGQELSKTIKGAKEEIQEDLQAQDFRNFKFEVDKIAGEWLERDCTFWDEFALADEHEKERRALAYLSKLSAALPTCLTENLNGFTSNGREGWKPRFAFERLVEGPQYVTRLLGQQVGLEASVPNVRLFATLCDCIYRIDSLGSYQSVQARLKSLYPSLERLSANLLQLSDLFHPTLELAKRKQDAYVREILEVTKHMHQIGIATQKKIVDIQIDTLLSKHESEWLESKRIGERKFLLSDLVHRAPMVPDFTFNLHALDRNLWLKGVHNTSLKHIPGGGILGGAIGFFSGGPIAAAGMGIGSGALWYVASGGLNVAVDGVIGGTFNWLSGVRAGRERDTRKIEQKLSKSLFDLLRKSRVFPSAEKRHELAIRVEHSNRDQSYEIATIKLWESRSGDFTLETIDERCQSNNSKSLIAFWIRSDVWSRSFKSRSDERKIAHYLQFERDSLIQYEDIERITPAPDTQGYAEQSQRMLKEYFSCLRRIQKSTPMDEDSPFRDIVAESNVVHSAKGEFLPLLLPNAFLQAMEQALFSDNFELMATETGSLIPSFDFRKEPSGERYEFVLIYRIAELSSSQLEEYGSFQVATFDRAVVESFRRITFPPENEQFGYAIGEPNLQEFLLQAFYGHLFKLGLPGKGTTRLKKTELFVPQEVPFDGLHALLAHTPYRTLHYASGYSAQNPAELFGGGPVFRRSRASIRFWFDAQQDKRKPKSLQQAASAYVQQFYLSRALWGLFSNVDSESIDELFTRRFGLFTPTKPDLIRAYALLNRSIEGSVERAAGVDHGLFNIGNSCWMNVCLQWLHKFPRLRQDLSHELRREGKDEVANMLYYVLEGYSLPSASLVGLLENLRSSLFEAKIYEGDPEGLHDPADLLTGRIAPEGTLSFISFEVGSGVNLSQEAKRAFNQYAHEREVVLPEYIVAHRQRPNVAEPAVVPENRTIELGGKQYTIVGLIEYVEIPEPHYVAYVQQEGVWTRYDDEKVGRVDPERDPTPPFGTAILYLLEAQRAQEHSA